MSRILRNSATALLMLCATVLSPFHAAADAASPSPSAKPAAAKHPIVSVAEPWIAAPVPGSNALAGYMTMTNRGKTTVVLKGLSSTWFTSVEAHENMVHGGMTHMHELESITLAPGASRILAPGGDHLMLMRPTRTIKVDDIIPVSMDFGTAGSLLINFPVRPRRSSGGSPAPAATPQSPEGEHKH